jgi:mRNA interferase HicA
MKTSAFKRFLATKGAKCAEGAKHTKVYLDGRQCTLPRQAKEISEGLRKSILRQLGIKD